MSFLLLKISTPTERMTIALSAEMAEAVKIAVSSGDYVSNSEVFREALRAWSMQRREDEKIMANVHESLEDLENRNVTPTGKVFKRLEKKYRNMQE